ncbi:MAG: hypothetical protein RLZZ419_893 [Pseudomonadota bacterium]
MINQDTQELLKKMPTGIEGFDGITGGGLPCNRTSLVIGGPGTGKTVFALQMLVNGVRLDGEAGIFVTFEENSQQIIENAASFGWNLADLIKQSKLFIMDAHLSVDNVTCGKFDLVGLLAVLKAKANEIGAKRIVFDSLDVLLTLLNDPLTARQEIYRLHAWLAKDGPTGLITIRSESSDPLLSKHYGFMQFMADCVILLDHRLADHFSLREMVILKYRGSGFSENAFPLSIGPQGMDVINSCVEINSHEASSERLSSGVERLDAMLNGGFFCGSSILITGAPGTAKSTLGAAFAEAACRRKEKTLYVSFDEGCTEIIRNMTSIGIQLRPHIESGILKIYSVRTEAKSSQEHLARIKTLIVETKARCLVIDPVSAMAKAGGRIPALAMAKELLRTAKAEGITILLTSLMETTDPQLETTEIQISSIADTWIHVSFMSQNGERNRALTIVKSRGTGHSHQVRELILSAEGVTLQDVYTSKGEVLMGAMRWQKEHEEAIEKELSRAEIKRKQVQLKLAETNDLAQLEIIKCQLDAHRAELSVLATQTKALDAAWTDRKKDMGELRGAD